MEKPLTTYVKEKQGGLYLVKINKDNFESFCSKNGVQSLPKMHVYVGGERKEESGYKEGEALRQLVNKYCP
ncbi:hypothetical protein V9T40_005235 [Parthenolecanium corni]|uniref:Thioredoxin domain-containing protein n=1 Tax=Parthenolecanium corni TaxID=536013 RepID=A0AAN9TDR8_9HEMI